MGDVMIKKILVIAVWTLCVHAAPKTFIKGVVNKTSNVLYEIQIPREKYKALVFPNEEKALGHWVELSKESPIYIAALKGDGEAIFLEVGPEASGSCSDNENLPQSMIIYKGQQKAPSNQRTYFKYCGKGDVNMEFNIIITPDGTPQIVAEEGVESSLEF